MPDEFRYYTLNFADPILTRIFREDFTKAEVEKAIREFMPNF